MMLALAHARSGDYQRARGWYEKAVTWMKLPTSGTFELRDRLTSDVAALLRNADVTRPGAVVKEANHSK
jgi:hypothetical protein